MDLREFIEETIGSIADAVIKLQEKYESKELIINPPVSLKERDLYEKLSAGCTYRRVETVEFDVAVTATSETGGGGRVGLKILSAEAGVDGKHARRNEEVSRVRFSVPVALPPSSAEGENKEALKARNDRVRSSRPSMGELGKKLG